MVDFTKVKKNFMTVVMKDGKKIFVCPPKKKTLSKLMEWQGREDVTTDEAYALTAEILSYNKQNIEFTTDDLDDWDITDIKYLFEEYVKFVQGELQNPN